MDMQLHRVEELIELLTPVWKEHKELNLMQMLALISERAGYAGDLSKLTDDVLIYQLKMWSMDSNEMIPGLAKDKHDDFKTALLKARGLIK